MKTLGQVAREAFWKDNKVVPWGDMSLLEREEWEGVANAVMEAVFKQGEAIERRVKASRARDKNEEYWAKDLI